LLIGYGDADRLHAFLFLFFMALATASSSGCCQMGQPFSGSRAGSGMVPSLIQRYKVARETPNIVETSGVESRGRRSSCSFIGTSLQNCSAARSPISIVSYFSLCDTAF